MTELTAAGRRCETLQVGLKGPTGSQTDYTPTPLREPPSALDAVPPETSLCVVAGTPDGPKDLLKLLGGLYVDQVQSPLPRACLARPVHPLENKLKTCESRYKSFSQSCTD